MEWFAQFVPEGMPVPLAIAFFALAAVVIGIAKSGFGGGVGILAVPLTAAAMRSDVAVGVLLPILIVADIFAVVHHRKNVSPPHVVPPLIGLLIGVVAGTVILLLFQQAAVLEPGLNLSVGIACLLIVALQLYRLLGGHVPPLPNRPITGVIAGSIAGCVSTLAHAAGPIVTLYFLEIRLAKRLLIGTMVVYFFLGNLLKLPTFFGLGLINTQTLTLSALGALLVPIGSVCGLWMHHRIPEKPFMVIMYVSAAAAGAWMILKTVL